MMDLSDTCAMFHYDVGVHIYCYGLYLIYVITGDLSPFLFVSKIVINLHVKCIKMELKNKLK